MTAAETQPETEAGAPAVGGSSPAAADEQAAPVEAPGGGLSSSEGAPPGAGPADNDPQYGVAELEAALAHYAPGVRVEEHILYRRDGSPVFVPPAREPSEAKADAGIIPQAPNPPAVRPMPVAAEPTLPDYNQMSDEDFNDELMKLFTGKTA